METKKSICAFIHYAEKTFIPYYVKVYLGELSHYFDEIRLITNKRELTNIDSLPQKTTIHFEKNEGYDFGMFYKFFKSINIESYHTIACINDSNILINSLSDIFSWGKKHSSDFWGIIDSNEKPWFSEHVNNHHLQSHFLVFRSKAIHTLKNYFTTQDIDKIFSLNSPKELRRKIINDWEIGLTVYFKQNGFKPNSFIQSKNFNKIHFRKSRANTMHKLPMALLKEDFPLIKKRMLQKKLQKGFIKRRKWERILNKSTKSEWNSYKIINDVEQLYQNK